MHRSWYFMADTDTDYFFFKQQTKNERIHEQDVYLVFNRFLPIENNNCNRLKLKA